MRESSVSKVEFGGELTVSYAAVAHLRLTEALQGGGMVEIDCTEATEVDLSFVQLLLAARKSAQAAGKRLRLSGPAGGALLAALERGGLVGGAPIQDDSFWTATVG